MIRKAVPQDLGEILRVYEAARAFMRENGNPTQWGTDRPAKNLIEEDFRLGRNYVIEEGGKIHGVFALIFGTEPTYLKIDGAWPDDAPYVTIHRIAGDGSIHGVLKECLAFTEGLIKELRAGDRSPEFPGPVPVNIRIDTHADNSVMRHLLEKEGFIYCGIIIVDDGTPRRAYQKNIFMED